MRTTLTLLLTTTLVTALVAQSHAQQKCDMYGRCQCANADIDAQVDSAASTVLDQEEIKRRRDLVRTLFNDFWRAVDDKPAAFVERLDQAEDYLNERLAVKGELWRLDANTRTTLGLPRRSSSPR